MSPFLWRPGDGPEPAALARMCAASPRPRVPMGEAWFMGDERRMFDELAGDLTTLKTEQLVAPLEEIASGVTCFGAFDEWLDWYAYLLPRLLPRCHQSHIWTVLEYLVTAFIAIHRHGIASGPYAGYGDDALHTLGRAMMDARCWRGADIALGTVLRRSNNNPAQIWLWGDASGDLTSSLFFCLKYLPASHVPEWFASVLAIASPHWRAQLIAWLIGAHPVLAGEPVWPADFEERQHPSIDWAWSHCLHPHGPAHEAPGPVRPFIPPDNARAAFDTVRREMTPQRYDEWLESMLDVDALVDELAELPDVFERLYVRA